MSIKNIRLNFKTYPTILLIRIRPGVTANLDGKRSKVIIHLTYKFYYFYSRAA
jgi:hypothetical protein